MSQLLGHLVVEPRSIGRVWVAKYQRARGTPTRKVLGAEPQHPRVKQPRVTGKTFGTACDAYLEYLEFDKGIAATTLRRYKGIVRKHLKLAFGETTPLTSVSSDKIDRYRSSMLEEGGLSPSSMCQHMIVLGGDPSMDHRVVGPRTEGPQRRLWVELSVIYLSSETKPPKRAMGYRHMMDKVVHGLRRFRLSR